MRRSRRSAPRHSPRVEEYLDRVAAEEGIPLAHPDFVPNTHNALALAELARDAGPELLRGACTAAIFSRVPRRGTDISDRDVLMRIARDAGVRPAQVAEVWDERLYDERLAALRAYALQIGVSATPSAIVCDQLLIGSRPYGVLEQALGRLLGERVASPARTRHVARRRRRVQPRRRQRPTGDQPRDVNVAEG